VQYTSHHTMLKHTRVPCHELHLAVSLVYAPANQTHPCMKSYHKCPCTAGIFPTLTSLLHCTPGWLSTDHNDGAAVKQSTQFADKTGSKHTSTRGGHTVFTDGQAADVPAASISCSLLARCSTCHANGPGRMWQGSSEHLHSPKSVALPIRGPALL
jgi:hypothetical protein